MKVLQLGKFYPVRGGVEKVMYDLFEGLNADGIHCDMLCARIEEGTPECVPSVGSGHLVAVKALAKLAGTMIAPSMPRRLRRLVREENYDLIHVHHPDPMAALSLLLSGYKGKVVLHWHSDILSQKFFLAFYKPLQNWLIRRADLILGTTPVYVEQSPHLAAARASHKRISFLPIGVRPLRNAASDASLAAEVGRLRSELGGRRIIFSLGRLIPYKGYETLIEAAALLPDDCIVVIGGGGPLEASLRAKVSDMGLEDKVRLLSRVPDGETDLWYNACDLFCMSSVWKTEAFGIVQIEAMSLGKPLVATRIPESGVSWVNEEGVSGLNAEPGDPRSLADCILAVLEDAEKYSLGAAQRYAANFTYGRMIERCKDFYGKIL